MPIIQLGPIVLKDIPFKSIWEGEDFFSDPNVKVHTYMTFCLVTFFLVSILVKSQTDRQTYRQIAMHTHRWAQKNYLIENIKIVFKA